MIKTVYRVALMFLILAGIALSSAEAKNISRQNPYRTFNLSGRNYASLKWQKQHQNNRVVKKSTRRVWRYRR